MERLCENTNCKKKLREYRDQTIKLYNEVDSVENDLKEREEFLQLESKKETIIKVRLNI